MHLREGRSLRVAYAFAGAGMLLVLAPAVASATVRFASPTGANAMSDCTTQATACTLQRAVEVVAANGDEVIVLPGTYNEGSDPVDVTGSKYVHGAAGQSVPDLQFDGAGHLAVANGNVARLSTTNVGVGVGLSMTGGIAEQIIATVTLGDQACSVAAVSTDVAVVLRDSICWGAGVNNSGVSVVAEGGSATATLRNVTAIATSGSLSIGLEAQTLSAGFSNVDIDAKNVIAQGQEAAVEAATTNATHSIEVVLENSNYATEVETGTGTQTITDPGTGANQVAPPSFANAAAGNFHQLASSPTVDAGASFFLMGSLDVDGGPRLVDGSPSCTTNLAAPDIGADEFVPSLPDCVAPETGINGGPKAKTPKRRAAFTFVSTEISTFQCSIDEKPFVPCTPPKAYRKLKRGKHEFSVRAVDAAGNLDATPAQRIWRIVKKRKK